MKIRLSLTLIIAQMKLITFILLTASLVISCSTRSVKEQKAIPAKQVPVPSDPVVSNKDLLGAVAGSAYLKRATGYFLMADGDTSAFMPIFSESKETGQVSLNLNLPYAGRTAVSAERNSNAISCPKPYSKWIKELKMILPVASNDYNLDSLKSISIGRLILTGDLAIKITRQYKNIIAENERITTADYDEISRFLLTSALTGDFNELLKPWSLKVSKVSIEKTFFTTKGDLLNNSVTETNPSDIPETILDCITWLIVGSPGTIK
ncbi:MAG: hypothetical protein PHH93_07720 [Prolixibacteraceae bacterium]|nr:hypothetical protein [Prolixibacteraceae bacterium]